jgi:hypothetical protein
MAIRFAILAGVSTDHQAGDDKASIPDQVRHCRAKIAQFEGKETAGPFIMDGYSRSGYDSLDVAMSEIPPLGEAIRSATADKYDVLIMDNFDRLGDLAVITKTRFKKLRKQLYSARQSGKLVPPDQYDPYQQEDADIAMYVQGIIQTYRINKLRRGWTLGIPQRVRSGLHPTDPPYGYRSRSRQEAAEIIPEQAALVRQMKDWYLAGVPLTAICAMADQSGVKPRYTSTWKIPVVKGILLNPFYAGRTTFGRQKRGGGQRTPVPPSKWLVARGKHEPLWDEDTHAAILAEDERRQGRYVKGRQLHTLTGLLVCSVCGRTLYHHGHAPWFYMDCSDGRGSHVRVRYELAMDRVADAVVHALEAYRAQAVDGHPENPYDAKVREQTALRARIQEGFEGGVYTVEQAQVRIVSVETALERLVQKQR